MLLQEVGHGHELRRLLRRIAHEKLAHDKLLCAIHPLLEDAHAVEKAGAFAVVLEMVPSDIAGRVTDELSIPTISVGAGPQCDGQLMVWTDWAGFTTGRIPRFVKQYADLAGTLLDAATTYKSEVESGAYPAPEHEYGA